MARKRSQTKANERANREYNRLRKNALAKIRRMRARGIAVGNIIPDMTIPNRSNTWEVKRAARELEKFNDRKNAYVAGRNGTPIKKETERRYREVAKKAEKVNRKWFDIYGKTEIDKNYTVGMREYMLGSGGLFGRRRRSWVKPTKNFTQKELEARISRLEEMLSPDYEKTVVSNIRNGLVEAVKNVDPELGKEINKLSDRQILALNEFTDVMSLMSMYYNAVQYRAGSSQEETYIEVALTDEDDPLLAIRNHIESIVEEAPGYEQRAAQADQQWNKYKNRVMKDTGNVKGKETKKSKKAKAARKVRVKLK